MSIILNDKTIPLKDSPDILENNDDKIYEATLRFYKSLSGNGKSSIITRIIDTILKIMDNIIENPYLDKPRLIDYNEYIKSKLFSYSSTIEYFTDIGFRKGISNTILTYPYDIPINNLIKSKEILMKMHNMNEDKDSELNYNIDNRITFPLFKIYGLFLHDNLLSKNIKKARILLKISIEEARDIYDKMKISNIEEYISCLILHTQDFQNCITEILLSNSRSNTLLKLLCDLWIEVNIIRKFGVYINQCFADNISKALLSNSKESTSRTARQMLMIDLLQAQGIYRNSKQQIKSIEDIVKLYIVKFKFESEELNTNLKDINKMLEISLYSKEKVGKFWKNVEAIIVERVTRKKIKDRPSNNFQEYEKWFTAEPPILEPFNLSIYTKQRLIEYASEILKADLEMNANQINQEFIQKIKEENSKKLREFIWNPKIWLHQQELIDDYIAFTAVSDMCKIYDKDMALDIRVEFKNFMKGGLPWIDLKKETSLNLSKTSNHILRIKEKKLDYTTKVVGDVEMMTSKKLFSTGGKTDDWKLLYRDLTPVILHAAVMNRHADQLKHYLGKGIFTNIRDHKKWTPLHYAAMIGDIEITNILLEAKADIYAENENHLTPLDIALQYEHYKGEISVCSLLIEHGFNPTELIWDKLLRHAVETDTVVYIRLAYQRNVFLHAVENPQKFSLHIAIRHQAIKVIQMLIKLFDLGKLRSVALLLDDENKNALDRAMETFNQDLIKIIEYILGIHNENNIARVIANCNKKLYENKLEFHKAIEQISNTSINYLNYPQKQESSGTYGFHKIIEVASSLGENSLEPNLLKEKYRNFREELVNKSLEKKQYIESWIDNDNSMAEYANKYVNQGINIDMLKNDKSRDDASFNVNPKLINQNMGLNSSSTRQLEIDRIQNEINEDNKLIKRLKAQIDNIANLLNEINILIDKKNLLLKQFSNRNNQKLDSINEIEEEKKRLISIKSQKEVEINKLKTDLIILIEHMENNIQTLNDKYGIKNVSYGLHTDINPNQMQKTKTCLIF